MGPPGPPSDAARRSPPSGTAGPRRLSSRAAAGPSRRPISWGMNVTDLNQGVVHGVDAPETGLDPSRVDRMDYDSIFGTEPLHHPGGRGLSAYGVRERRPDAGLPGHPLGEMSQATGGLRRPTSLGSAPKAAPGALAGL